MQLIYRELKFVTGLKSWKNEAGSSICQNNGQQSSVENDHITFLKE